MGGICGIINLKGRPVDEGILRRMLEALRHRGPDASGIAIQNLHGISVGLGCCRLGSVKDAQGKETPVFPEGQSNLIALDGELYNSGEIGKELGLVAPAIREEEVILKLYEKKARDFAEPLNGAFALAIWDGQNRRLTLARDRIGVKPLYYFFPGDEFVFASELKALLCYPRIEKRLDLKALSKYLAYEYIPSPAAIIEKVQKLRASHILFLQGGRLELQAYSPIRFSTISRSELQEGEIIEKLRSLLLKAVERRLAGPVLPGIFLSGGIDSSAMVAMACRLRNPREIKTFTIGFQEKSFDESGYALQIARHFGTDHHEEILDHKRSLEIIPEVFRFLDEPFADASIIPTSLLCRFARKEVPVALGGDGGDEFFRGYPTFLAHRLANVFRYVPGAVQDLMKTATGLLPVSMDNMSFDFRAKRFLKGVAARTPEVRNQVWLGAFSQDEQKMLFQEDAWQELSGWDPYEDLGHYLAQVDFSDLMDRIAYIYIRTYLADDGLVKTDRASTAVSLGVRAPILDNELLDYVNALPPEYKFRGTVTKYIFKKALEGILPREIIYRGKKGFGMPVAFWLRGELKGLMLELLDPQKIKREGLFRPDYLTQMVQKHLAGKEDNRKHLWSLICFELWRQNYL